MARVPNKLGAQVKENIVDATAKRPDPRPGLHVAATNDLSWSVLRENVVLFLHDLVARKSALGVVPLRRIGSGVGGFERSRRHIVLERGPSPSATVREALVVLHHEVDVMLGSGLQRLT